ncbi:MAG: chloride channel protein [Acidobacteria bacterium]|jgi:CIC family chloride channel protein|nr:chloride channel protein [Acidobacteriota bacterium]
MKRLNSRLRTILINLDTRFQSIIIGIMVGICCGLAAVGLTYGLEKFSHLFGRFAGNFYILLFPMAGITFTVFLLKYIIKDFGGHGVPEVIYSISMKGGAIKFRSAYSMLIGSMITISSGGSAGPEAPVVISGAAIGSNIAGYFKTNERIRVAVTGSGAAAAIAAIFNAPITGIIFTLEVILGDWAPQNMLPVAIASVTGTIVSRLLKGNQIPFRHREFNVSLDDIFAAVGLAILMAIISLIFIRVLKYSAAMLEKIFQNVLVKAALGGLLVGLVTLFFPHVKSEGYEVVRELLNGSYINSIGIVILLILMKILATSLTLGAGGAGGVFAPSLFLGSLGGFFYFQVVTVLFPRADLTGAALFALVGMAGMLSGALYAPLSGIFLIVEITGGYDAILPLLLVSFLTYTLVKWVAKHSIYHHELVQKGYLLRPGTDKRILSEIRPAELLETDLITVNPGMRLKELVPLIEKSRRNYFPVEDKHNKYFLGMVYFNDIKPYLFNPTLLNSIIVEEVMRTDMTKVALSDNLGDILDIFDTIGAWSLPVVDNNKFLGLISKATLLDHYRKELKLETED